MFERNQLFLDSFHALIKFKEVIRMRSDTIQLQDTKSSGGKLSCFNW